VALSLPSADQAKTGTNDISVLIQIIYASQPFGYDEGTLSGILMDARRCNVRDGITGALVCRHDVYLQLLEGPKSQVEAAFARISRDDRHIGLKTLIAEPVTARIFAKWAMLHDPARSWIWTEADIENGALERATHDEVRKIFQDLANKSSNDPEA
jgi:hypothetical protein